MDGDVFLHTDEFSRSILFLDTGSSDQKDKRRAGAVHNRDLRCIDIDVAVVDRQTGQRTHQVLDRRNTGSVFIQRRRHARVVDAFRLSLNRNGRLQIGSSKHQTGIGRCRTQSQTDFAAGVQTDTDGGEYLLKRSLFDHHF